MLEPWTDTSPTPVTPPTIQPMPDRELCVFCGADIYHLPAGSRRLRRRWIAAIAALIGALVTTVAESVVLGETVADVIAQVDP